MNNLKNIISAFKFYEVALTISVEFNGTYFHVTHASYKEVPSNLRSSKKSDVDIHVFPS